LKLPGILLSVVDRTLVPYLRKLKQGKIQSFKKGYEVSALALFILGVITTLLIFSKFEFVGAVVGKEASIKLFCTAFGFTWSSLVDEAAKWRER